MKRRLMILLASCVMVLAFGMGSAYAEVKDELAPCPNCGAEFTLEWMETDAYGSPICYYDYIDDQNCKQWFKVCCSNCQHEDIVATYNPHYITHPYSEAEYVDSSKHKITDYGGCEWCGHDYTEVTYEKHSYSWVRNGARKEYRCSGCGHVAKKGKLSNPMSVTGKTVKVKYKALKKKSKTFTRAKVLSISGAKGTVTCKKVSGNKKITVKSNGKVTVKKGLKKGTYRVKVRVSAAGNATYNTAIHKVSIIIKVK